MRHQSFAKVESAIQQIKEWGILNSDQEICGILYKVEVGREARWHLVRLKNHSENPHNSYVINADQANKVIHQSATEVWVWHTHPSGQIGPSGGDLDSMVEGVNYFVVTIPSGRFTTYGIHSPGGKIYHSQQTSGNFDRVREAEASQTDW